jgi:hypothetical protein
LNHKEDDPRSCPKRTIARQKSEGNAMNTTSNPFEGLGDDDRRPLLSRLRAARAAAIARRSSTSQKYPRLPAGQYASQPGRPSWIGRGFGMGLGMVMAFVVCGTFALILAFGGCMYLETDGFSPEGREEYNLKLHQAMLNGAVDKWNRQHPNEPPREHYTIEEVREMERKRTEPEARR